MPRRIRNAKKKRRSQYKNSLKSYQLTSQLKTRPKLFELNFSAFALLVRVLTKRDEIIRINEAHNALILRLWHRKKMLENVCNLQNKIQLFFKRNLVCKNILVCQFLSLVHEKRDADIVRSYARRPKFRVA